MFDIKSKECLMKEFDFGSEKKSSDKAMISDIHTFESFDFKRYNATN